MRLVEENTVKPIFTEGEPVIVRHYEGDYTTPDGYHYIGGVHRVTATYKSGKPYQRPKTFKGETAWSRAERLFDDIVSSVQYSR